MEDNIECYTDASYSQFINTSVVAYKIGNDEIILEILENIKNTEAELYAVEKCISLCNKKNIKIYTDCQKAVQNYKNNQYPKNVVLFKVEGHKKTINRDEKDKIFNLVDKAARKKLRSIRS